MSIKYQNKHYYKEINNSSLKIKKLIIGIDKAASKDDKEEYLNIKKVINQTIPKLIPNKYLYN